MIYASDIAALQGLLKIGAGKEKKNDNLVLGSGQEPAASVLDDLYELNLAGAVVKSEYFKNGVTFLPPGHSLLNMNWHDAHIKSDLDQKITPLTQASYLGKKKIVELMLENFAYLDLNLPTIDSGYTALSAACMAGHYDIVCLLVENGADVN